MVAAAALVIGFLLSLLALAAAATGVVSRFTLASALAPQLSIWIASKCALIGLLLITVGLARLHFHRQRRILTIVEELCDRE